MAIPDERLVLEASVVDDFTDTLLELSEGLAEIDRLAASTVENIEANVEIEEALRDLGTLEGAISAVDDEINIGGDGGAGDNQLFDMDGVDLTDEEAMGVADMFNPKAAFRQTPGLGPDSGDGATADGGGDGTAILSTDDIQDAQDRFGEAFSPEALFSDRPPQRVTELLDGDISDFIDTDDAARQILSGDLDPDVFERLGDLDPDEAFGALDELQDAGVTTLPTGLTDEFKQLELNMGDFFRIFAALIPLLAIFVGAIPSAIAGIAALGGAALAAAGALAGLGGLAVLGAITDAEGNVDTSGLTDRLRELLDTALAELGPVAQQFAPLLDDAFDSVATTIRGLADEAHVLRGVVGDFRGALSYIETTVPSAFADIVRFGDAAMPIISGILREAGEMDILQAFSQVLIDIFPFLALLTRELVGMLGPIIQLSRGFLVFATMLTFITGKVFDFLNALGPLLPLLGLMISVLLTAITATALFNVVTTGATGAVLSFAGTVGSAALSALSSYTVGLIATTKAQYGLAAAAGVATVQVALLLGVLTFGLAPALGSISSGFTDLSSDIEEATGSLKSFNSAAGGVNGVSPSMTAGGTGGYRSASDMTVVAADKQTGNAIANTLSFTSVGADQDQNVADRLHTR